MSDHDDKKAPPAAAAPKPGVSVPGLLLPALLAGAAAFGGARIAGARGAGAHSTAAQRRAEPPGATVALEPFLVTVVDASRRTHPMRVTLALECDRSVSEEALRLFVPRIRDAGLRYLRGLTYENVVDNSRSDRIREELLEQFKATGVGGATRVLITDLVVQ